MKRLILIAGHGHKRLLLQWISVGLILLNSCALNNGASYGLIRRSRDVERDFEAFKMMTDTRVAIYPPIQDQGLLIFGFRNADD